MREIELKILNVKEKDIENKLISLGAKKKSDVFIEEKIFDFDDNRIKDNKELFRVRKIAGKVEIAYKDSRKMDSKFLDHEEIETEVKDFEIINKIIEKLGLKTIKQREKRRVSFVLNDIKIEIDKYPDIPTYIEIECKNKKEIEKLVQNLGYSMKDTTSKTATEVLKDYNVDSNVQKFNSK